jgi:high affinity Mn2+ porin
MVLANPVRAADLPLKAPQFRPAFDWSGFYVGGHTGYGRGSSSPVLTDPLVAASSGTFGGAAAGWPIAARAAVGDARDQRQRPSRAGLFNHPREK